MTGSYVFSNEQKKKFYMVSCFIQTLWVVLSISLYQEYSLCVRLESFHIQRFLVSLEICVSTSSRIDHLEQKSSSNGAIAGIDYAKKYKIKKKVKIWIKKDLKYCLLDIRTVYSHTCDRESPITPSAYRTGGDYRTLQPKQFFSVENVLMI